MGPMDWEPPYEWELCGPGHSQREPGKNLWSLEAAMGCNRVQKVGKQFGFQLPAVIHLCLFIRLGGLIMFDSLFTFCWLTSFGGFLHILMKNVDILKRRI